ncbi:exodeoxyribonuclease VII small subunit [Ekhidna sp.]|uniref:exodeoxyribonuclease VII small subunit n=1 Tax=Ekhidna sp. TaxID=2608089 RepID=UPI003CCC253B
MDNITYEEAAKELEEILSELKEDQVSVDQLAAKVERAAKLAAYCSERLRSTENQIQQIIEKLGL